MTEISGSFTLEQINPALLDSLLADATTRHDVQATFGDGTRVEGWFDVSDVEVTDGELARVDIQITKVVDPDGTVHDWPGA